MKPEIHRLRAAQKRYAEAIAREGDYRRSHETIGPGIEPLIDETLAAQAAVWSAQDSLQRKL